MTKIHTATHAYIVTGGDDAARRDKAELLGDQILKQADSRRLPTTFTYIRTGGTISRKEITDLLHDLSMTSFGGEYRIVIIEGAEQMTPEAGNSLLKSLEEPPEKVIFMLLAPTVARLMPTLRSRSQIVFVGGPTVASDEMGEHQDFFQQTVAQRFAHIAGLKDRSEQLAFAEGLLLYSQSRGNYAFASWMQEKLVLSRKSGNARLLLEASAVMVGEA